MRHGERGSSMVEFAIAAAALMLFVFGIFEFARALYAYHTVSNAARLGARWAIVRGANCSVLDHCQATQADVQNYVQSQVVAAMNASSITVSVSWPGSGTCASSNARGCPVQVTVNYPFAFDLPFISTQTLTISSSSQMTIAN